MGSGTSVCQAAPAGKRPEAPEQPQMACVSGRITRRVSTDRQLQSHRSACERELLDRDLTELVAFDPPKGGLVQSD